MISHSIPAERRLLAALALSLMAQSGYAEHVIIETNAGSYMAGQILASETTITLAADEFLVAIAENGTAFRLEGPYEGIPEDVMPVEVDITDAFARIIGAPRAELGTLGGVRAGAAGIAGEPVADTRPSPWLVHAELTGDQCILSGQTAEFWRENASGAASEVSEVVSGASATIRWPANGQRTQWPSGLAPREASVYLVRPADQLRSTAIRLHELDPSVALAELSTVAWLAAKGCVTQARLLLADL